MEPNSDFFSKNKTRNIIRPQQCRSLEVLHHLPHHRCLAKADIAHFVLTQSTCFPKLSLPGILPNSRSPKIRSTAPPPWARIRSSLVASSLCVVCCQCEALSGADRPGVCRLCASIWDQRLRQDADTFPAACSETEHKLTAPSALLALSE